MPLLPDQYFPCLAYVEREAIKIVYASFVPTFFVCPCKPVDDYYAAHPLNFEGRQQAFESMFQVLREEVEIFEGLPPVECYIGFYTFFVGWGFYDPICCGGLRPDCRQDDYSPVQT